MHKVMNNITVIRTKRKTISIKVNNDLTVTVRAPIFTSDKEIGEILKSKEKWISKCIEQIKRENDELSKIVLQQKKLASWQIKHWITFRAE